MFHCYRIHPPKDPFIFLRSSYERIQVMLWFVGLLLVRFVIIFFLENIKLAYQIHFAFVIVSADNEQKLRQYTIHFYVKPAKTTM